MSIKQNRILVLATSHNLRSTHLEIKKQSIVYVFIFFIATKNLNGNDARSKAHFFADDDQELKKESTIHLINNTVQV